jgi:AraC-like DNA-binding protein
VKHSLIMMRFKEFVTANSGRRPGLREVSQAIGVNERTLRTCCHEDLGMAPNKYIRVHRLELARQALRAANSTTTTVTYIALGYGFSELGRFAHEYQRVFGELPSETLNQIIQ